MAHNRHIAFGLSLALFSLLPVSAYAGSSTYFAKLTLKAVGHGLVYADPNEHTYQNEEEYVPDYQSQYVGFNSTTSSSSTAKVTITAYAKSESGYTFDGWYKDQDLSQLASQNNPYSDQYIVAYNSGPDEPTEGDGAYTLYAGFSPKSFTIKYDPGAGTIDPNEQVYTIESTDSYKVPYRSGHEFLYWEVTEVESEGNWNIGDKCYQGDTLLRKYGNVTLTAHWRSQVLCNLTINASGLDAGDNAIFDVVLKDDDIKFTVSAHSSVTLKGIPVGTYIVTPKNSWAIKYSSVSANNVVINPDSPSAETTFYFSKTASPKKVTENSLIF